jgi:DNA-binding protein HU-beta
MGRNPASGEPIKIAAKPVVKFKIAKAATDTVGGKKPKPPGGDFPGPSIREE